MQYLAFMLQDIEKWNGRKWGVGLRNEGYVFGSAGSEARMALRDLYSIYYSALGKRLTG
jgi:hypothetical protein